MEDYMLMGMGSLEDRFPEKQSIDSPHDSQPADPTIADPTVTEALGKTRRVQVKLTTEKLLSDKGLPYLVKYGPKRLRISTSRNSPYDNLSHIIRFYQLWAHELFPKAKFKDFIKICRGLKNDRALREYRTALCLREMAPSRVPTDEVAPQDREQQDVSGALPDAEDLYTESAIDIQGEEQEQMLDTQPEEDFDEDRDAMEAMKEMGF